MNALVKKEDKDKAEGIRVKLEEENRNTVRIWPRGMFRVFSRNPIEHHHQPESGISPSYR